MLAQLAFKWDLKRHVHYAGNKTLLSLHYKNSESWFTAVSSAFREFKVNKQSEAATLLHNLLFPIACSTIEFYDMSLNPNTPHTPAFHLRFEDNAGHDHGNGDSDAVDNDDGDDN